MDSKPASSALDVDGLRSLGERDYGGLRIDIGGPQATGLKLLRGDVGKGSLTGIVRETGPLKDLIGTYWAGIYLISDRFRSALEQAHASGWDALPVSIENLEFETSLSLFSVTGRCGPAYGVGGISLPGLPRVGTFIDPDQWDGSDIFVPDDKLSILVVESLARVLDAARLSNLEFEPAGLEALPHHDGH